MMTLLLKSSLKIKSIVDSQVEPIPKLIPKQPLTKRGKREI